MSSNQVLQKIDRIIKNNPRAFDALMEFEKTGKLKKTVYRERINLTIDSGILNKFKIYCRNNNYNMSRLIESHMKKDIGLIKYKK
jgi:hypothetical protein